MATAASDDEKSRDESDVFNCTICLERFTKPKYLPCLHTFCEACLNTYIISTQSGKEKPVCFSCPVCRQEVNAPDAKSSIEEWAKLMPLNHMIFSLMESNGTTQTEGETKCSPCERDEENAIATFWCLVCQDRLCDTCKKHHKRNKSSATHKLVPISDLVKSDISTLIPDTEEPCPVHKGELLKVYCEDHQEMCCVICLSINHRRCDNIKTLDQMADSMKMDKGNVQLVDGIERICTSIESLVDKKQQNIDSIQIQQQDIMNEASDMVDQAIKNLQKCKEEFKIQLSQIHKEQRTKLMDAKDRMATFQTALFNYEKMLKTVLEHGSPKQIFITSEKIKKQMKIHSDALQEFLKDDQEIEYQASIDDRLISVTKMTSVAKLQVQSNPCDSILALELEELFFPDSESSELQSQVKMADITNLEAVKIWNVNGDGRFTGGIFLNDGRLLCIDNTKNTIQVFDENGILQISHSVEYHPCDVAQHSDGRIFITGTIAKTISIYNWSNNALDEIKALRLQEYPFAINIIGNYILVVAGSKVHIMTLQGAILRTFGVSCVNCYIATSTFQNQESKFYYCDNQTIYCKTINGTEVQKFKVFKIESGRGISLDCAGNIYICGRDSSNVVVVSKDFKSSHVFMSDIADINKPYAMGFDKSGTKLFISAYDNGSLAVYQLCVKK